MGAFFAISNRSLQSFSLSPCACKKTVFPLFTASMVPSPPSASETMKANLDHALSAVVSGNREITPAAPSAATRRVGDSRALVSSSMSIAAPRIATFCSLRTSLL